MFQSRDLEAYINILWICIDSHACALYILSKITTLTIAKVCVDTNMLGIDTTP